MRYQTLDILIVSQLYHQKIQILLITLGGVYYILEANCLVIFNERYLYDFISKEINFPFGDHFPCDLLSLYHLSTNTALPECCLVMMESLLLTVVKS